MSCKHHFSWYWRQTDWDTPNGINLWVYHQFNQPMSYLENWRLHVTVPNSCCERNPKTEVVKTVTCFLCFGTSSLMSILSSATPVFHVISNLSSLFPTMQKSPQIKTNQYIITCNIITICRETATNLPKTSLVKECLGNLLRTKQRLISL